MFHFIFAFIVLLAYFLLRFIQQDEIAFALITLYTSTVCIFLSSGD